MKRVLAVGGAGKWFSKTYWPILAKNDDWCLTAVVDLENQISSFQCDGIRTWAVRPSDTPSAARDFIDAIRPDLVIVSASPETHVQYCEIALSLNVDVICDKPPVAIAHQFSTPGAGSKILEEYTRLLRLQSNSKRIGASRPCNVFIPLRRRRHRPFGWILEWLTEVERETGVMPTSIDIAFNDGSFRCAEEYDRPGAHGYRNGLGILTHTGYHFIDFAAACLSLGGTRAESIVCTRLAGRNSQTIDSEVERSFFQLLGRNLRNHPNAKHTWNAEVDARFHVDVNFTSGQVSRCHFALMHHGCTQRQASTYDPSTTHDEGRVDDLTMMIQQGPFQSIQVLISDSAGGTVPYGHCVVVRRLHPILASHLKVESLSMHSIDLFPGDSAAAYAMCIRDFLNASALDAATPEAVKAFTLAEQTLTTGIYASFFSPGEILAI